MDKNVLKEKFESVKRLKNMFSECDIDFFEKLEEEVNSTLLNYSLILENLEEIADISSEISKLFSNQRNFVLNKRHRAMIFDVKGVVKDTKKRFAEALRLYISNKYGPGVPPAKSDYDGPVKWYRSLFHYPDYLGDNLEAFVESKVVGQVRILFYAKRPKKKKNAITYEKMNFFERVNGNYYACEHRYKAPTLMKFLKKYDPTIDDVVTALLPNSSSVVVEEILFKKIELGGDKLQAIRFYKSGNIKFFLSSESVAKEFVEFVKK